MNTETSNPIPNGAATTVDLDAAVAAMATPVATSTETIAPVATNGTVAVSAAAVAATVAPKRRGRPPGSKNTPKAVVAKKTAPKAKKVTKVKAAKRGRPPGSKNKPKTGKVSKPVVKVARKSSRVAGVKAQAQIEKALNKRFIAEAKEQKIKLSHVIRDYIYRGAKYTPAAE